MPDNKFPKWPLYVTLIIGVVVAYFYSKGMLEIVTNRHKTKDVGQYKIEFSNRGEQTQGMPSRLTLVVTSENKPKEVKLAYYSLDREQARPAMVFKTPPMKKEFIQIPMQPAGDTGFYTVTLRPLNMAEQYYFYFILADEAGNYTFPKDMPDGEAQSITYRGEGNRLVTVLHITLMFMVIFFMLHVLYYSLAHIGWKNFPISKAIHSATWANICFFITSFPIGCYVAWKAYGMPWTGIPEVLDPNDVDNKSLFIFIYWVVILLLIRGINFGRNKISSKVYAWLSLVGAIATVLLFVTGGHI